MYMYMYHVSSTRVSRVGLLRASHVTPYIHHTYFILLQGSRTCKRTGAPGANVCASLLQQIKTNASAELTLCMKEQSRYSTLMAHGLQRAQYQTVAYLVTVLDFQHPQLHERQPQLVHHQPQLEQPQ